MLSHHRKIHVTSVRSYPCYSKEEAKQTQQILPTFRAFHSLTLCKVKEETILIFSLKFLQHFPQLQRTPENKKENLHLTWHTEVMETLPIGKNSDSWSWEEQEKQLNKLAEQTGKSFLLNFTATENDVEHIRTSSKRLLHLLHQPPD